MKKKLIVFLTGIMAFVTVVAVIPSAESQACSKCSQSNLNRKCGKCGSSKLFVKKTWVNEAGQTRHYFKCDDCEHDFIASSSGAIITGEKVPQD